jgi:hypothetical protein
MRYSTGLMQLLTCRAMYPGRGTAGGGGDSEIVRMRSIPLDKTLSPTYPAAVSGTQNAKRLTSCSTPEPGSSRVCWAARGSCDLQV